MEYPKRGEIWLVSLGAIKGHEIGKTRPALIISNDRNNQFSQTLTVIPLTSKTEKTYPFEVLLLKEETQLSMDSKAKCNQIRTIDRETLIKLLGILPSEKLKEIENATLVHLDIYR